MCIALQYHNITRQAVSPLEYKEHSNDAPVLRMNITYIGPSECTDSDLSAFPCMSSHVCMCVCVHVCVCVHTCIYCVHGLCTCMTVHACMNVFVCVRTLCLNVYSYKAYLFIYAAML